MEILVRIVFKDALLSQFTESNDNIIGFKMSKDELLKIHRNCKTLENARFCELRTLDRSIPILLVC